MGRGLPSPVFLLDDEGCVHCGGVAFTVGEKEIVVFGGTEDRVILLADEFVVKNDVAEVGDRTEDVGFRFHKALNL